MRGLLLLTRPCYQPDFGAHMPKGPPIDVHSRAARAFLPSSLYCSAFLLAMMGPIILNERETVEYINRLLDLPTRILASRPMAPHRRARPAQPRPAPPTATARCPLDNVVLYRPGNLAPLVCAMVTHTRPVRRERVISSPCPPLAPGYCYLAAVDTAEHWPAALTLGPYPAVSALIRSPYIRSSNAI